MQPSILTNSEYPPKRIFAIAENAAGVYRQFLLDVEHKKELSPELAKLPNCRGWSYSILQMTRSVSAWSSFSDGLTSGDLCVCRSAAIKYWQEIVSAALKDNTNGWKGTVKGEKEE